MQEVLNTSSTNYISNHSQTTKTQQTTNSTLFQSLLENKTAPQKISFEEYKKLSNEDIENLFLGDKEATSQARSLKLKTTWTQDDTFNSILFKMQVEDINNNTENSKMFFHAIAFATVPDMIEATENIDPDNLALTPEQEKEPFWQEILKKRDGIKTERPEPSIDVREANDLLDYLGDIESFFEEHLQEGWSGAINQYKIFDVAQSIVNQYNKKTDDNAALLASYTRTNSASPTESTEDDKVQKTDEAKKSSENSETSSKYDKMFQKIVEDGYVSYDELEYLTYEQATQLPNYLMQKDEDGEFIKSTLIGMDRKAGMLVSATVISENNSFNKAIFHSIRRIEDDEILDTFMFDITGTQFSDKIIGYPELQEIKYKGEEGEDIGEVITNMIAKYQSKLDNATTEEDKEFYQEMLGVFTGLDHMKKSFDDVSIHDNSDPLEKLRALVEDIVSMLKTGFTVEELEQIEELLKEIKKQIKEHEETGSGSLEDIHEMIKDLERAVAELQKRVLGVAIIDATSTTQINDDLSFATSDSLNFDTRLDAIKDSLEQMKSGDLELSDKQEEEKDTQE